MAWTINIASDYLDLMERLKNFATASCGWTVDEWDTAYGDGGDRYKLIMHGPGSGSDEIYTGINSYYDLNDDYFNWEFQGFTGYSAVNDFHDQAGAMTQSARPGVRLWNSTIPYWLVGSGRRIMGVAKVDTTYQAFYLGWYLPYGLPTEISYPLVIGGSYAGVSVTSYGKYSNTNYHGAFPEPYYASSFSYSTLWVLAGDWLGFGATSQYSTSRTTWPYNVQASSGRSDDDDNAIYDNTNGWWFRLKQNIDGTYPMFPVTLAMTTPYQAMLGELEGVYAVPGWGLSAEDTIEHDGDTYIVFPTQLTPENWEYFAMKMT